MTKVGIVMGSDSDMPVMAKAADILEKLGVEYEMTIISAHREPDVFFEYAKSAESKGWKVIIAGAGMAAHLPGMCAAIFPMPVIGIPMHTTSLGGRDSLYSIVQMPSGIAMLNNVHVTGRRTRLCSNCNLKPRARRVRRRRILREKVTKSGGRGERHMVVKYLKNRRRKQ